jgi:hypothetical protein
MITPSERFRVDFPDCDVSTICVSRWDPDGTLGDSLTHPPTRAVLTRSQKTKTPFAQAQLLLAQTASLDQASSRRSNVRVRAGETIVVTAGQSQAIIRFRNSDTCSSSYWVM